MNLDALWQALEGSGLGQFIAGSTWAFPTLESIHVIAIVTVIGSIAVMDLRLLGLASRDCAVTEMSRDTLPWTWAAFVLAVISGSLLFVSKATSYAINPYFQWKMVLLMLAGLNMAVFHLFTWRTVASWDSGRPAPTAGKIAGALSLIFWVIVVLMGRTVGFTLGVYQ